MNPRVKQDWVQHDVLAKIDACTSKLRYESESDMYLPDVVMMTNRTPANVWVVTSCTA
jgi:hypothetical protein